jgi:hypothetical protein
LAHRVRHITLGPEPFLVKPEILASLNCFH